MSKFFIAIIVIAAAAGCARAQEVEVPFDSAGKIMVLTPELERTAQFLPTVSNFLEAHLLRRDADHYILEYTYRDGAQTLHAREERNGATVAAMRAKLSARWTGTPHTGQLDHSSRVKFVTYETVLSTFLYGPMIISSVQVDDFTSSGGIELLIGGAGFVVPYLLTQNMSMSDAQSSLGLGGAFLGFGHGALIDLVLFPNASGREVPGVMAATSIVETAIGCAVGSGADWTEGRSDIVRYGGLFGGALGLGAAEIVHPDPDGQSLGAAGLVGSAAGLYVGTLLHDDHEYTRGDATVSLTAGIYGPYALFSLTEPLLEHINWGDNTGQILTGIGMAGMIGGVALSHALTRDAHLSTSQGNLILIGTSAGFLIGTGIGLLLSSATFNDDTRTAASFTVSSAIGTIGGFGLSYYLFSKPDFNTGSNWDVHFNPASFALALRAPAGMPQSRASSAVPASSMATLEYRW